MPAAAAAAEPAEQPRDGVAESYTIRQTHRKNGKGLLMVPKEVDKWRPHAASFQSAKADSLEASILDIETSTLWAMEEYVAKRPKVHSTSRYYPKGRLLYEEVQRRPALTEKGSVNRTWGETIRHLVHPNHPNPVAREYDRVRSRAMAVQAGGALNPLQDPNINPWVVHRSRAHRTAAGLQPPSLEFGDYRRWAVGTENDQYRANEDIEYDEDDWEGQEDQF